MCVCAFAPITIYSLAIVKIHISLVCFVSPFPLSLPLPLLLRFSIHFHFVAHFCCGKTHSLLCLCVRCAHSQTYRIVCIGIHQPTYSHNVDISNRIYVCVCSPFCCNVLCVLCTYMWMCLLLILYVRVCLYLLLFNNKSATPLKKEEK